jgi:hypothetical protein
MFRTALARRRRRPGPLSDIEVVEQLVPRIQCRSRIVRLAVVAIASFLSRSPFCDWTAVEARRSRAGSMSFTAAPPLRATLFTLPSWPSLIRAAESEPGASTVAAPQIDTTGGKSKGRSAPPCPAVRQTVLAVRPWGDDLGMLPRRSSLTLVRHHCSRGSRSGTKRLRRV